ncbi:hypothetical protein C8Q78DRAFT_790444 [Trametes maxima]|nr:hypothetical protein C8Q78DRAFT_790444 [Trametes maxima]
MKWLRTARSIPPGQEFFVDTRPRGLRTHTYAVPRTAAGAKIRQERSLPRCWPQTLGTCFAVCSCLRFRKGAAGRGTWGGDLTSTQRRLARRGRDDPLCSLGFSAPLCPLVDFTSTASSGGLGAACSLNHQAPSRLPPATFDPDLHVGTPHSGGYAHAARSSLSARNLPPNENDQNAPLRGALGGVVERAISGEHLSNLLALRLSC